MTGRRRVKVRPLKELAGWLRSFLGAFAAVLLLTTLLGMPMRVQGQSMMGTLRDGDLMLVSRPEVLLGQLSRGDVVVCKYPGRSRAVNLGLGSATGLTLRYNELFVKRLMGLPGDTIAVRNGQVWLNGAPVEEPYLKPELLGGRSYGPRTLGADEYFVIGDNRAGSHDSRAMDVGPISKGMIVGRPRLVILPFSGIRTIR